MSRVLVLTEWQVSGLNYYSKDLLMDPKQISRVLGLTQQKGFGSQFLGLT